jgi:hypothetical protein
MHALKEAEAAAVKQRAAAAQAAEQLRESVAARVADAAGRIERGSRRAAKMPELASMLAPFLGE